MNSAAENASIIPVKVKHENQNVPTKQTSLSPIYVLLASDDSSYMTSSTVQVPDGSPTI
ncbi:dehydrogenase [Spirosoma soli]|uniref:Dehydrogenase n=1 Tax=Spirosoma soli TaxID=1770529 RepID=A0ABW5LWP1_9BACT